MNRNLFAAIVTLCLAPLGASGQEDLRVLPREIDGAAPSEMMATYLGALAEKALDRRDATFEKLKTPEQVHAYQKRMREFFVAQLGGFPDRTPLNVRTVGTIDRDGYRMEKILFESQPAHTVTALLYLPDEPGPHPGVLVPCGHTKNGKAGYQEVCILLATHGMVALCYDPIGQGERYQVLDAKGRPRYGATSEHTLVGLGSTLVGRNTATYRIWDGMRAIDSLCSRKEVDPKRIGCTGNSGGGTLTSYLMALDDRIVCAAPSCYLTSYRRLLATIGPQDAEQHIHGQLAFGMGQAEYVLMRAPRPTLICAATRDFFDIAGTWDTFRRAKRTYTRLGFSERVDLVEADEKHGFTTHLRVAAVRWMRRWLLGVDDAITEGDLSLLTDTQVRCTPTGQVMLLKDARSVLDLNREIGVELAEKRRAFWKDTPAAEARAAVRRIAAIRPLADLPTPDIRNVGESRRGDLRIEKLIIEPERGIVLPALRFTGAKSDAGVVLYLPGGGKAADAAPGGPIEQWVRKGHVVLAADLRGLGETGAPGKGPRGKFASLIGPGWDDVMIAYMLGRSYVGMRAEDVLVLARHLSASGGGKRSVRLVAVGEAGPPALHAAALEPQLFASVELQRSLVSFTSILDCGVTSGQGATVVHGALRTYDLGDLQRLLAGKITVRDPVDATGKPCKPGVTSISREVR